MKGLYNKNYSLSILQDTWSGWLADVRTDVMAVNKERLRTSLDRNPFWGGLWDVFQTSMGYILGVRPHPNSL
jgi:hypothetical protein